jgi:hypothetical protein
MADVKVERMDISTVALRDRRKAECLVDLKAERMDD